MPYYRIPGVGIAHLNLGGKLRRNPPAPCCARIPHPSNEGGKPEVRCRAISTLLCDWPVDGGTCDAPLCAEHGVEVARETHLCPLHLALHRADHPEPA